MSGRHAAAALALLLACNRTSTAPSRPDAAPAANPSAETMINGRCEIGFRCAADVCSDYDGEVKTLRASVELQCNFVKECPVTAEVGRCGAARYTRYKDKFGEEIYWFDESGRAFARRRTSPFDIYCDASSKEGNYGPIPTCTLEMKENLVPRHD